MPVNQTGETILFRLHDGRVEAHVQIAYNGDPETFAWLVPVQALPEVRAGSAQLFNNLLAGTVPTYTMDFQPSNGCGVPNTGAMACGGGFAVAELGGSDQSADGGFPEPPTDDGPDVLDRGVAGAFQFVVISGDDIEEITDWLDRNGFAQDEDAPPILQEYLDEGFLFLALKLRAGAGVDEIHPIAFDYEGDEPCLPIRLTRIAAEDDMGIRAFFLGEARAAPTNYLHLVLNHTAISWLPILAEDYVEKVTLAVDEAGGQAFITEYAGPSSVVLSDGISNPLWRVEALAALEPHQLGPELQAQQLLACESGQCSWQHPLMAGIIDDFITVPEGVDFHEFWACTACYVDEIDDSDWDAAAFAAAVDERIVEPAAHALEMLDAHPYLTRMFTTMSPHEMTVDPMFHQNASLPELAAEVTATRLGNCAGPDWIAFPDGRQVARNDGFGYPEIPGLPIIERLERVPLTGAPMVELDNAAEIDAVLEAWNEDFEFSTDPEDERRPQMGCASMGFEPGAWYLLSIFGIAGWRRRRRA